MKITEMKVSQGSESSNNLRIRPNLCELCMVSTCTA